jgi:hypothetical protein
MALFDAVSLMAENPQNTRSIYDSMSEDTFREPTGASSGGGDDDDDAPGGESGEKQADGGMCRLVTRPDTCQVRPAGMLAIPLLTVTNP